MDGVRRVSCVCGEGRHQVEIALTITGAGVIAEILGGDKPHVGAVALARPRPSLKGAEDVSADVAVVPLPGHKDDELAKPAADLLARHFNQPAAVVVGLHIERADEEDIKMLIENTHKGIRMVLAGMETMGS